MFVWYFYFFGNLELAQRLLMIEVDSKQNVGKNCIICHVRKPDL